MNRMSSFYMQWVMGFIKYLGKFFSFLFLLILGAVLYQYLTCPVYRFPEPVPFSGTQLYNPYSGIDSAHWLRANFQVQSRAWGGLTDGRNNTNEVIDSVYRSLNYDIIATSDYQRINRWGEEEGSFIPVYEHGYGLFKNHQVLLGSRKVDWTDFPLYQNLHHKQHILNLLREHNDLVYIAHPGLRGAYKPEDMKYLTGYEGLEVLNYVIVSEAHWDSALSAGKYVTIMGNDDSHDVSQPLEVGHRCTYIYSASSDADSVISALRKGRAFGADIFRTADETMEQKAARAKTLPLLESVTLQGDTLRIRLNRETMLFRFVGQGGLTRHISYGGDSAMYIFKPEDTYIRTEIIFPEQDVYYLNPVIRYDGNTPGNPIQAEVDQTRSWIFWIISWASLIFVVFNIYYLPRRLKKSNFSFKRFLEENPYWRYLTGLLIISFLVRGLLAVILELGNDEVYYWTYALYPDLGHFDHPPMVGWVIQFFTLDLLFQDEFFLRLPGLVLGSLNIVLVFLIGRSLKDELTGWYASLLYTASVYCSVISGTFILPDTPQLFFWLLSLFLLVKPLGGSPGDRANRWSMILAGISIGLAMLSKYTSVFIWLGVILFIITYNRRWLKSYSLYLSALLSFLVFLPVIIWNFRNDFISFTFQGSRAGFFQGGVRPDFFVTELSGEALYNNPIVFVVIIIAIIALLRGRKLLNDKNQERLILFWSIPLIALFLLLSFFRQTLPHWTGPAYTTLIFLAAGYLSGRKAETGARKMFPFIPISAILLLLIIMTLGVMQINHGLFYTGDEKDMKKRGEHDVSMDMFGWEQVRREFRWLASENESRGIMPEGSPIISHRWFPAANLDYYVARHTGKKVLALGSLESIHKYAWINEARGGFREGMDAYFITTSRDYKDPKEIYANSFREIKRTYYFPIHRGGKISGYGFVFHLKGFKMSSLKEYDDILPSK